MLLSFQGLWVAGAQTTRATLTLFGCLQQTLQKGWGEMKAQENLCQLEPPTFWQVSMSSLV